MTPPVMQPLLGLSVFALSRQILLPWLLVVPMLQSAVHSRSLEAIA